MEKRICHPPKFWNSRVNQRQFFEHIGERIGIKAPADWGEVTSRQFLKYGGSSLLGKHGNLRVALKEAFPGTF